MWKSDQKKTQIRRVEEEDSSDSEESDSETSESGEETPSSSEKDTSLDSFEERSERKAKKKQSEKSERRSRIARLKERGLTESKELIGKLTEVIPKSNDTIELKMKLNGEPVNVILDTGSPISIVPRSMRE